MHCNSIYKQNDFKVCKIITNENTTLGEIQKKHKTLSLLYKPIYIQNLNCNAIKYNKIHGNFILVNGTVPKIIQNTLVNLTITGNNNEYTYNGEIWDCLPNEHVSIPRIFNKHGIKSFILK